jgi:hypothetical protein
MCVESVAITAGFEISAARNDEPKRRINRVVLRRARAIVEAVGNQPAPAQSKKRNK